MRVNSVSEFNRNVLTLVSGTTLAQAIPILLSPILTRIYTPAEFGALALFMAVAAFVAPMAGGAYELAVTLPKEDNDANAVVVLTLCLSLVTSVVALLLVFLFGTAIQIKFGLEDIGAWMYAIPLSILGIATFQTLNYWLIRQKSFKTMSASRVAQTSISGLSQIAFGLIQASVSSLIAGAIFGQLVAVIIGAVAFGRKSWSSSVDWLQRSRIVRMSNSYKHHPYHLMPGNWIGAGSAQLPYIIVTIAHGAYATGLIALAIRIVSLPTTLVGIAIGDVYRQQASALYNEQGEFHQLYRQTLKKTFLIACIPTLLIYILLPDLVSLVFGASWREVGELGRIIVVASFFQLVLTPIDKGSLILGATRYLFCWELVRFSLMLALLLVNLLTEFSLEATVWAITIINVLMYSVDTLMEYHFSQGKKLDRWSDLGKWFAQDQPKKNS